MCFRFVLSGGAGGGAPPESDGFRAFQGPAGLAGEARRGPDHDAGDFREFGGGKLAKVPHLFEFCGIIVSSGVI